MSKNEQPHVAYINGLRAIAAIYVVMHHIALQFPETAFQPGIKNVLFLILLRGHYAVDLFIVISGYCLALPILKNNYHLKDGVIHFFKHRAIRILPAYYLTILISLLFIYTLIGEKTGTIWDRTTPVNWQDVVLHFILLQDIFISSANKINYPLWSISVEFRIYLLFPLLVYCWRKLGSGATLLITVIFSIVLYFISSSEISKSFGVDSLSSGVNPYIILFVLGMIAAKISKSEYYSLTRKSRANLPWNLILFFTFIISLICDRLNIQWHLSEQFVDVIVGIFCATLLITCAKTIEQGDKTAFIAKFLSMKPLAYIGTFAYSIYLIHAPIIQIFTQYVLVHFNLNHYLQTMILIFIGTPIIVSFSYCFFLCFELPFLGLDKKQILKLERKEI